MATHPAEVQGEGVVGMRLWEEASSGECLRGEAISLILLDLPHLEGFLFHPTEARLRASPEVILRLSKSYSSGEQVLIRVALDVWSGQGGARVSDLIDRLDPSNLRNVLNGLRFLIDQSSDN